MIEGTGKGTVVFCWNCIGAGATGEIFGEGCRMEKF